MSLERELTRREQREYEQWLSEMQETIRERPIENETETDRAKRIAKLKKDFTKFCRYYFPEFMDADFAWFHKKAARVITERDNIMFVGEWPREHAKSVEMDIFLPLFLKSLGKLTGVVLASANEDKANGLLADLQEQLMFNESYKADYGPQYKAGKWDTGHFVTNDGIGFWAFGRGQSPRGVREAALRPNLIIVDDIVDTAGTLCNAAGALKERGALGVVAYITHPVLSGAAIDRIKNSALDELVVTDTIPLSAEAESCPKIRQVSCADLVGEALSRIAREASVSSLFTEC